MAHFEVPVDTVESVLIAGLQPGLRLKLFNDIVLISGGLSFNPVVPLPFRGMDFGIGAFLGTGFRIKNIEIGVYHTNVIGRETFFSRIRWFSVAVSKAFRVSKNNKNSDDEI